MVLTLSDCCPGRPGNFLIDSGGTQHTANTLIGYFIEDTTAMIKGSAILLSLLTGCLFFGTTAFGQDLACTPVIEKKCTECHDVSTICAKVKKKKSSSTWKQTLATMIDEGASPSKEEVKMLVQCLSEPSKEIRSLCQIEK